MAWAARYRPPTRMRGQSLALGLLLLASAALVWVHLYNGGQMVAARSRLTHAADAVAYSGALLQARALNMHAYINRAQVAHQIAMGHLVTLASWAQFGDAEGRQTMRFNPPAALIGMLFGAQHGTAYAAASAALGLGTSAQDSGALGQAYAAHERTVHEVLVAASDALVSSLVSMRLAGMRQVLAANFRPYGQSREPTESVLEREGLELTVRDESAAGRPVLRSSRPGEGLRALIDDAAGRYGFLQPRNHTARNAWPVSTYCPQLRHELRRRGNTVLSADGIWQSGDTQSFQALRANRWVGCYYREYPMGWGLEHASHIASPDGYAHAVEPPDDFSQQDFWRWVQTNTNWELLGGWATPLADSHALAGAVRWPSRGLPVYGWLGSRAASRGMSLTVTLRQQAAALATTDAASKVRIGSGPLAYKGLSAAQGITVMSAAQTYFARPKERADGRSELASLFHPYWQARLAPPPKRRSGRETRP